MSRKLLCSVSFLTFLGVSIVLCTADDAPDPKRVRELHQKVRSGEKLTPEEQAYYERGKAARRKGSARVKAAPVPSPAGPSATSTGLVPLCDMGSGQEYKGEGGGLYGGGNNAPPAAHLQAALEMAAKIQPLNGEGQPAPDGKIVLLTHGMSNTTNESQQFIQVANADPRKNPAVLIVDGAQGGIDSRQWVSGKPARNGGQPWDRLLQRINAAGATPQQVQVVWMKHAIARVGQVGAFPEHARQLEQDLGQIARRLKEQFPNLQLAYVSSRTYAGYATTELNPEPYAYESAFAVRWLIQDQIQGHETLSYSAGRSPLLLWGPYLWADGERGRKIDDLSYQRQDFRDDGTHPADSGRQKVAEHLVKFFTTDPTAKTWFLATGEQAKNQDSR